MALFIPFFTPSFVPSQRGSLTPGYQPVTYAPSYGPDFPPAASITDWPTPPNTAAVRTLGSPRGGGGRSPWRRVRRGKGGEDGEDGEDRKECGTGVPPAGHVHTHFRRPPTLERLPVNGE
ncbi:hypothetical protein GCM10009549_55730 [Streptomyces thermoalcalitolerans]|uniref:Uncharacterized protein n=1 Tax=Streptomyces thermoalcalitolerans TaxID=65605 RepID=A0ABN1PQV5_9ACTN